jgi:hypothetical protein
MSRDNFVFEERKFKDDGYVNKQEYHKGGGGDEGKGFFSIKTNVYSKQCYSDPNNPGKMICKETKNSTGYDPFNKDHNYKKSKENVYTQEDSWNGPRYNNVDEEDISFYDKM